MFMLLKEFNIPSIITMKGQKTLLNGDVKTFNTFTDGNKYVYKVYKRPIKIK